VPLVLALIGTVLIIVGQLDLDSGIGGASLPAIPEPTPTPFVSPTPTPSGPTPSVSPTPSPTPNPNWIAVQIQIETTPVINIPVKRATSKAQCDFPPENPPAAWVLCGAAPDAFQPGRGRNSYIFAHAQTGMFLPLWNVQLGAEIRILMSDRRVLVYHVTEIHPNVSCPDTRAKPMSYWTTPPLALQYPLLPDCQQGAFWSSAGNHERLTLQTSQGYNRNFGEYIVVAEPVG
jgi:hypothetical protein